ncbi:hypothetical protein RhiirA5_435809 [Rhizophagus irregularis]|uniref:Uncharacterized protein n=1 Tax=Rhizophagus irregularis TaxID=588596 RepID=A0A2N0NMY6_9GLOM|nr:hypothetical protein RhiirA5_435809 [Rhizophagus irregularis]
MTDNNAIEITLNCLIVPVGNLIGVPCSEIGVTNSLSIRQINPGSISERPMQSQTLISDFFNQPPEAEFFHVTVYSR